MQFEYKILLIGDNKVGKSAFVERIYDDTFTKEYTSTEDGETTEVEYNTTYGNVTFNIWDLPPSVETYFYRNADAAICMFDVNSTSSFRNIPKHIKEILRWNTTLTAKDHVVICGSMSDVKVKSRLSSILNSLRNQAEKVASETTSDVFFISAKEDENIEKVMLHLARKLTGFDDLEFLEEEKGVISMEDYGEWSSH